MALLSSGHRWMRPVLRRVNNFQWNNATRVPRSLLSSVSSPLTPEPPEEMNEEIAMGIQDSTSLYIRYGVGRQRLTQIANDDAETSLVVKWQQCMESFLGVQVHVLSGLGYTPDESGIGTYNQQLAFFMQDCSPDVQEKFRLRGRDTWREVLGMAFNIDLESIEEISIVDARNIMHKVSERMRDKEILGKVAKKCASIVPNDNPQIEMAQRHHMVQETMVHDVYLGGEPSLVSENGFGDDEEAYVRMQMVMSEHTQDPLVSQYVGTAMMEILKVAGLDQQALQAAATSSPEK